MDIDVNDLKAHLSEYLGRVLAGEDVIVTDQGRPIARLVPFSRGSAFDRGIDAGWVEPARRTGLTTSKRSRSLGSVMGVLDDDRG